MICQEEFSGRYYKKALDAKKLLASEFAKAFEKEYRVGRWKKILIENLASGTIRFFKKQTPGTRLRRNRIDVKLSHTMIFKVSCVRLTSLGIAQE